MDSDEDCVLDAQTAAKIAKNSGRRTIFQRIRQKAERGKKKMLVKISKSDTVETENVSGRLLIPFVYLEFLKTRGYQVYDCGYDDYYYVKWCQDS